jgi:hypothetical protein
LGLYINAYSKGKESGFFERILVDDDETVFKRAEKGKGK